MSIEQLQSIAVELEELRTKVREKMNQSSAEDSDKLFLQILEINHRLLMIDQAIFKAGTIDLANHVEAVKAATEDIDEAIADIQRLADAVNAIKSLLGIVDSAIDLVT